MYRGGLNVDKEIMNVRRDPGCDPRCHADAETFESVSAAASTLGALTPV